MFCSIQRISARGSSFQPIILLQKKVFIWGGCCFMKKPYRLDNNISCESCHQQKLAFTDGKAFSTGTDGSLTARSSMSLANLLMGSQFLLGWALTWP